MLRFAIPALAISFFLSAPCWSQAADSPTPDKGSTDKPHSGAPLGQFKLGALIVTPTLRIGNLAVDTNVLYQRQRRVDFLASGGPGLDLGLPFLDHWKLDVQGTSEYFYFQRTKELRRWTGGGEAALQWATTGTRASVSTGIRTDFSRPNFEVDTRLATTRRQISGRVERDLGRLTLVMVSQYSVTTADPGQTYRGADLSRNLTSNQMVVSPEFRYYLTPLTSLILETQYQSNRFPDASIRNFNQESVGAGFRLAGLFTGEVVGGARRQQLAGGSAPRILPYVRSALSRALGQRVTVRAGYVWESLISAFAGDGEVPTIDRRTATLDFRIRLGRRLDLNVGGGRDDIESAGVVEVVNDDGTISRGKRNDVAYVSRGDIGITLGRARISLFASYTTRVSEFFRDFGIDGMQAGARVSYSPGLFQAKQE